MTPELSVALGVLTSLTGQDAASPHMRAARRALIAELPHGFAQLADLSLYLNLILLDEWGLESGLSVESRMHALLLRLDGIQV